MKKLIAIDPATKALGWALFEEGSLITTGTIYSKRSRIERNVEISSRLIDILEKYRPEIAVLEDPLLRGKSNTTMQRLIGVVEDTLVTAGDIDFKEIYFFSPSTVKARIGGSGQADKLQVALEAGNFLKTSYEKELIAKAISSELFDETDAAAVGLTYYESINK